MENTAWKMGENGWKNVDCGSVKHCESCSICALIKTFNRLNAVDNKYLFTQRPPNIRQAVPYVSIHWGNFSKICSIFLSCRWYFLFLLNSQIFLWCCLIRQVHFIEIHTRKASYAKMYHSWVYMHDHIKAMSFVHQYHVIKVFQHKRKVERL